MINYAPKQYYSQKIALKNIDAIEHYMLQQDQVKCNVVHRFNDNEYIREVSIPANTYAIGHHQNFEHQNVMIQGRVTIFNDDGSTVELSAPQMFIGKPGRKIGYIHEDMIWLNIYQTKERDIDKLESYYLTKSDVFMEDLESKNKLRLLQNSVNVDDYRKVLEEFGFTEKEARDQSENKLDMIDFPNGEYKIKVDKSSIEGMGLFATSDIECGELIAQARIHGMRTIAGRFTNHSLTPNAKMVMSGNDINIVAIEEINGCKGGQIGDEITINYRDALSLQIIKKGILCQA